ncbi:MAG: hypothetical protein RL441_27 [Actinomycetota bacterium]|jgi:RNA polymerase sigma-70 factor (ECF subfamily)
MSDLAEFSDFYEVHASKVLRSVVAATGRADAAEDATAEAFQRAWATWSRLRKHPAPAAWVAVTASNLVRDDWRKHQRGLRLLPKAATAESVTTAIGVDQQLLACISNLPPRQREVIALRILLDQSAEQTATALGITAGSVGTHLSRALAALRAELSPTQNQD